jgi:hypothetical protein
MLVSIKHVRYAHRLRQADESSVVPFLERLCSLLGVFSRDCFVIRSTRKAIASAANVDLSLPLRTLALASIQLD